MGRALRVGKTVAKYRRPQPATCRTIDIPQADRLAHLRRLALAIRDGVSHPATLQEYLGVDARHFNYYRHGAELLALAERDEQGLRITSLGERLLATAEGSLDERAVFRQAIAAAPPLAPFASLFAGESLTSAELARRIEALTGLSSSTARRRARTLLRWRRYLIGPEQPAAGALAIPKLGEQLERMVAHHNAVAKQRTLDWLHRATPARFEGICAELLAAMGYGQVRVVGGSGDGGVDVLAVHRDRWGHELAVAAQAKRWARSLGRRVVDEMIGVLVRGRLGQAILITTSDFSKAAREAGAAEPRLRLVNGAQLVELMAAHDVIVGFGRHGELVDLDPARDRLNPAPRLASVDELTARPAGPGL
ncbi:Mrr restriction system protein [Enhygromyxa salina]|uniref:Mrr restriction system protein n=1 Tax=Enhygromyxa salina TaxID=215803 RepID=A0A2S9XI93_9BACT|nr:restriction endonuclease [Enhygromyxa salina]PRP92450.1 Mrr restriction system protein [Enhygromyxa salina]